MSINQDAFGNTSEGLDRGTLHVYTSVKAEGRDKQSERRLMEVSEDALSSPAANFRRLSRKLRPRFHKKTKGAIFPSGDQRRSDSAIVVPALAPAPPSTSEKDRFSEAPPEKPSLPPLKDFIKSPLQTAKTVAHSQGGNDLAENLAKTDTTHGASVRVVRAYDKLAESTTDSSEELALKELELLKKARQDSFVRWTLDRHIKKVRRLQVHRVPMKPKEDFLVIDERGREVMQWKKYGNHLLFFYLEQYGGKYIGVSSDSLDPTEGALMAGFERVLLTSAPLQDLFLRMRSVGHWEDPSKSVTYMATYLVLLYYNYLVRAGLLLILLFVLKRRYYPPTIESMRQNLERSEDRDAAPTDLSQHIDQYGGHGWVDPLVEKAGPVMLSHIEDLADFLEILRNFYEWRDPTRTAFTLGVIAMSWLAVTFIPLWLLVKGSFFAVGVIFFGFMPISYRYPKYRLLLSPLTWTFWKIPTHAEWAIARLQAEATQQLEALSKRENSPATGGQVEDIDSSSKLDPSASSERVTMAEKEKSRAPPVKIGQYHCIFGKQYGKLCLSTHQVSFETPLSANERWSVHYENMHSIQKLVGTGTVRSGDDILFTDTSGREFRVSGLKDRDEVFSQIIGYSSVRWQRTG